MKKSLPTVEPSGIFICKLLQDFPLGDAKRWKERGKKPFFYTFMMDVCIFLCTFAHEKDVTQRIPKLNLISTRK